MQQERDEAVLLATRPMPRPRPEAAVVAVSRMNSSGNGKMSYADNSDFQRVIASVTKKARQELAAALYRARGRPDTMAIADLGCATGPNALLMVSDAVEAVLAEAEMSHHVSLHVFLNDLPANDFNAVFRLLPSSPLAATGRCLVSAWPGSFYERVFPEASLDYVVSSSSLHFLSKAPTMRMEHPNRGRFYVSESGPAAVLDAYRSQFHADFLAFLSCRAAEMRPRGLLLLTFVARRTARPTKHDCYLWDLLADALMDMAAAGLVHEDQVHAFNTPFYGPCPDDLARVIAKEGSFTVRTMQLFDTTRRCLLRQAQAADDDDEYLPRWLAMETASTIRAVVEPMLRSHFEFGCRDAMDGLFCRYSLLLEAYYRSNSSRNKDDLTNVFLVLEKKHH